jgi:hypothetical protein
MARVAEEPADVVRHLVEEVPRIVLPVHTVEHAAAVGMDETAEKLAREPLNDAGLPWSELDLAPMLPPWPVLRRALASSSAAGGIRTHMSRRTMPFEGIAYSGSATAAEQKL